MAVNARKAAVNLLNQFYQEQGYSNIVLNQYLTSNTLEPLERFFLTALFYGVIERRITLDYIIGKCSNIPFKKMHPVVLQILRIGVYQLLFMDKVPSSAAVNESVKLTKQFRLSSASGFVNAVLRNVGKQHKALMEALPPSITGDEVRYSCPSELITFLRDALGTEFATAFLQHMNDVPQNYIRLNTLKTTTKDFENKLKSFEINCEFHPIIKECLYENSSFSHKVLARLKENWYYHQDASSQLCCLAFDAKPGETVADVCAAPGGKSFTIAQYMQNQGKIISGDVYDHKCNEIKRRAGMFGISILTAVKRDASEPCPPDMVQAFDRVLCDVPCSGLGVIRRKPEIRYKSLQGMAELPTLQLKILEESSKMVKPGGILQYSTCTINPLENEKVVEAFLQKHPEYSPRMLPIEDFFNYYHIAPSWKVTLYPHIHATDGFFIAGMIKEVSD